MRATSCYGPHVGKSLHAAGSNGKHLTLRHPDHRGSHGKTIFFRSLCSCTDIVIGLFVNRYEFGRTKPAPYKTLGNETVSMSSSATRL